jgi:hypothetical protein
MHSISTPPFVELAHWKIDPPVQAFKVRLISKSSKNGLFLCKNRYTIGGLIFKTKHHKHAGPANR